MQSTLFSLAPNGEYCALCESDGRLRFFDTDSQKCLWTLMAHPKGHKEGYLRQESKMDLCWITTDEVMGRRSILLLSSEFGVEAVDIIKGEVIWQTKYESGVAGLTSEQGVGYFCALTDRSGGKLNLNDGAIEERFKIGKHKAKQFRMIQGVSKILIGGSHLILWNAVANKNLVKFTGHSSEITILATSPEKRFALSAAKNERHVAVWNIQNEQKSAVCLLSMQQTPMCLSTGALESSSDGASEVFAALAVSEDGIVHLWRVQGNETKTTTVVWAKIQIRKTDKAQETSQHKILFAKLLDGNPMRILLVQGNAAFPSFTSLVPPKFDGKLSEIELEPSVVSLLGKRTIPSEIEIQRKKKREALILGADNNGEAIQIAQFAQPMFDPLPINEVSFQTSQRERLTLGERLERLEKKFTKNETAIDKETFMGSLSASSAVVLIHQINQRQKNQSLQGTQRLFRVFCSGDMELYTRAMRLPNDIVIATVKKLNPEEAAKFLQFCVQNLRLKPKTASSILNWIRSIVKFHAAYLMAAPGVHQSIAAIHQMIETRLAMFDSLMTLSGRLDLLTTQIQLKQNSQEIMNDIEPQITVDVPMSEEETDEEIEDDKASSNSFDS